MFSYRLGLDVGTNSLGWSVLKLEKNGDPCSVETAGSRIFSDGRDVKSKATLAADRREARSARRRRDRFKQRQEFLLDELTKAGLFPEDTDGREALRTLNPLELRAKALKEKLPPHHVGRALFHLNQRRGFQSNRKDRSEETTSGKVSKSVRVLLEQMGLIDLPLDQESYKALSKEDKKVARQQEAENRKSALSLLKDKPTLTYGSFLWERYRRGEQTRARPGAGDDGKLYDVYPQRELYEDEFNKIWAAQAKCHDVMTDDTRKRIHHVIFTQRPLKPQKRGKCVYLPKEDRTFRAMPGFQRYRMYQEVNNLEWMTSHGSRKLIHFPDARDLIIRLLETPTVKNGQVVFGRMKKILKQEKAAEGNFTFNFETPKRKGLDGNLTSHLMRDEDRVGGQWDKWSLEEQDSFIMAIFEQVPDEKRKGEMREQTDDEVCNRLMQNFGLSEFAARNCLEAPMQNGIASVSLKAARLLIDQMKNGPMIQSDAVQKVADENPDFVNPFTRAREGQLLDSLPYYGEAFQDGRHIIPGDRNAEDKHDDRKYYGGVTNPTVHIALNQIRQVVNELIRRFGRPSSIAVELGRELPAGKEGRTEIENEQKANQDRNEKLDKTLREQGQNTNRDNRLRLLLWEDLDSDPNGRCCPFSGDKIGITDLFNANTEIEHLIPFSRSLDDSRANKIICTRKANRDKGNGTPFEAFGHNPDGYNWAEIFERTNNLPKAKQWRFKENAMEIWSKESDFTERHLNDTRYIGRLTREYLECICPIDNIDVLTGRMTSLLRWHWSLTRILQNKADGDPKKKNRNDHRHHAVDAIVIGMTSRSMLQKVSTAANRAEALNLTRLFEKGDNGKSPIDPWDGFRDDVADVVRDITVSHKAKRKEQGHLHKKFTYGIADKQIKDKLNKQNKDQPVKTSVVLRRGIKDFTSRKHVEEIRERKLREAFLRDFDEAEAAGRKGIAGFAALATEKNIRHLRVQLTRTVQPIRDKTGNVYKAFWLRANWATEFFEYPDKHKKAGQWVGETISRYEANQPGFRPSITKRPHPAAKLIMRLQTEDCVEIEENSKKRIMRVQKMSGGGVYICEHQEANVADRLKELVDNNVAINASASLIQKLKARKVHISPTGLVNYEKRRKPRRKK